MSFLNHNKYIPLMVNLYWIITFITALRSSHYQVMLIGFFRYSFTSIPFSILFVCRWNSRTRKQYFFMILIFSRTEHFFRDELLPHIWDEVLFNTTELKLNWTDPWLFHLPIGINTYQTHPPYSGYSICH